MKFDSKILKLLSLVTQVGLMMFLPIIGCMLLGNYIDDKLKTSPIFLIIFTIIGVLSAFRNLFVISLRSAKDGRKGKDK